MGIADAFDDGEAEPCPIFTGRIPPIKDVFTISIRNSGAVVSYIEAVCPAFADGDCYVRPAVFDRVSEEILEELLEATRIRLKRAVVRDTECCRRRINVAL